LTTLRFVDHAGETMTLFRWQSDYFPFWRLPLPLWLLTPHRFGKQEGQLQTGGTAGLRSKEHGGTHDEDCFLCRAWVRRDLLDSVSGEQVIAPHQSWNRCQ
jgi:hypothetical protein